MGTYRPRTRCGQEVEASAWPSAIRPAEASAGLKLNTAHRLQASYSTVKGRSDTNGDGKVDTDLDGANISPDRLNLRWLAQWSDKFETQIQASRLFDRKFPKPELNFTGYSLFDVSASYRLPVGRLTAGVENLFNRDYVTYYSQSADSTTRDDRYFKGRGRTLTVGYRLSF